MKHLYSLFLLAVAFTSNCQNEILWTVAGALQPNSVQLRAKLSQPADSVRALVSTTTDFTQAIYSSYSFADTSNNQVAALSLTGLQPNTKYYYAIEANGVADTSADDIGEFHTPDNGPYSYNFIAGSCNRRPETPTYGDFLNYDADFYLNMGDLHYDDPCDQDMFYHRDPYETRVFNQPLQAEVYRKMGFAYIWDDHDYCGNDANGGRFPGTIPARRAYREYIPHYPLQNDSSIYQAFDYGRVRFIMTELRSERLAGTTTMGATQKQWFKNQLLDARDRKMLVCWVSSYSWYGVIPDNWGGETAERRELSEFFRDSAIANMFIINGDAHMVAVDDGRNGDFTAAKNLPYRYPLMQAGPIWGTGSWKGGTYSEGQFYSFFTTFQQYGVVKVNDNGGDSVCVTMEGYRKDLNNNNTSLLVTYSFCRNVNNPSVVSGIQETGKVTANVYPNPMGSYVMVTASVDEGTLNYNLLTVDGRLLKQGSFNGTTRIDTEDLQSGSYLLHLVSRTGNSGVYKLIK